MDIRDNIAAPADALRAAMTRAAESLLASAEKRARMAGPRAPKSGKKAKSRPGRPAKMGPSAGCGTGAGGFKAGNNCAKEDGIPQKPFSMGGALKQGPKGELQGAKAQIAAKQAKVAIKQAKQQDKNKQTSIAAKKSKAAIRKKQKEDKAAEAQKQADAAAVAKKKAMLQKIRVKKANEKLAVAETPKSVAQEIKEAKVKKAAGELKIVGTPKSIAQEIAEAKAAAAAKTAEKGKPAPYKLPKDAKDAAAPPEPTPPPSSLTVQKPLGGSTGAQLAIDPATGKQYVIKGGKSAAHIENESQADDLYRAAGVNVPQQQMHPSADGPKKVAEFIKGKTLQELKDTNAKQYEAAAAKVRKNFVADALFANYDVVGMNLDNIVVGKGGKVYRVDNGGSLTFRAQGKTKEFGPEVKELDSLRNASINPSAASVFGKLTDKDINSQINAVLKRKDAILAAAKTPELKSALEARMAFLAKWQKAHKNSATKPANPGPASAGEGLRNPDKAPDELSLFEDRKRIFGANTEAAWNRWHPDVYKSSITGEIRAEVKAKSASSIAQRLEKMGISEADVTDDMLGFFGTSHGLPAGLDASYARRYRLAAGMADSWAGSSGKGSYKSVGIQRAVAAEFGLKGAVFRHMAKTESQNKKAVERIGKDKAVRAVVRAQHEETQEHFKKLGITHITVSRGYSSSGKVDPSAAEQTVSLQPASSFSLDRNISNAFGDNRFLTVTVPVKRVMGTCVTGFGCLNEQEIVLLGGKISGKVRTKALPQYFGSGIFTPPKASP